ncbi:matrixin family metalloprotease [Arthrobacter sp. H41]|uniref:matrixin family metalloprotease n=1 Tax=Arthrobacter sp. H41 TaxID=1312978 RepID=UPI0004B3BAF8|nr:matrixin family metalloprotease [Arthrobacter sp. H41]
MQPPPPNLGGSRPPRRRRPSSKRKLRWGTIGVVAVVGALYLPSLLSEDADFPPTLPFSSGTDMPPPDVEASDTPLGVPPEVEESDDFVLLDPPNPSQDFIAYDPCRPVHYVVRPEGAPAGSEGLIEAAVAEISAATGLQFVYDGTTTEGPSSNRDTYQPDRYGERWAPVLFTWTNEDETPGLEGTMIALGSSEYAQRPGTPAVYVAGQVKLDVEQVSEWLEDPEGRFEVKGLIMHELGHVVGLDHIDDRDQLMHATAPVYEMQDGDRAGFALLGTGPCVPEL